MVASPFSSRVATRVFAEFTLVLFAPLVLLSIFGLRQVEEQLEEQALDHLETATKDAAMTVLGRIQASDLDLEVFLGDLAGTGFRPDTSRQPHLMRRLGERFLGLTLFSSSESLQVLGRAQPLPSLTSEEREHLAAGHMTLIVRQEEGLPRLLALRSLSPFGLGDGALVAEFRLDSILPVDGAQGLALTHDGMVLCTTNPEFLDDQSIPPGSESGAVRLHLNGEAYLGARREVFLRPQFGIVLGILLVEPLSRTIAPLGSFRTTFALTAGLLFLLVLFVGSKRLQQRLVPVALLSRATREIADGKLDGRIELRTGDEFEELGEAFNEMTQRIRERTRELMEASAAKSRFLANMSHEIRTPMNSILGYAELGLAAPGTPPQVRESLDVIQSSGRHLLRVINDVLDVSRIEVGRLGVERTRCSPARVLEEAAQIVRPQWIAKKLDYQQSIAPDVPGEIHSDPDRLRQILVNLLSNAVKFTERGGVSVRIEPEGPGEGGPQLRIEVRDTGCGIEPASITRLFQPFALGDESMSRRHGGIGLGLFISRSLARLLGGELSVTSEVGKGSTFRLTIEAMPLQPQSASEVRGPLPEPTGVGGESVAASLRLLVVEDVLVNRRLVVHHLRKAGHAVDDAENGQVAESLVTSAWRGGRPYDLVLMDMQMPVLDGYQATRALRNAGYDGAIVALTAHAIQGERERCLAAGCDDFVTKPIVPAELLAVVLRRARAPRARYVAALTGSDAGLPGAGS